ncbi:MAG: PqqD family protein [Oscillospiraceae bacterium]|jgi:hypothetical protein|nr:PqqD family protein [Oscillospiraceae bacterium]
MLYRKQNVLSDKISETDVILSDPDSGKTHLLNRTASAFYDVCDGVSRDDASERYAALFAGSGAGREKLRADAEILCNQFLEIGIITEARDEQR